ncbi:MAG: proton-conducting transporter membrane subunit [Hyphomonadaceae bacterium]
MSDWPLLSIVTFLPTAGALLILLSRAMLRGENAGYDNGVRLLTLLVTLATFAISLFAFFQFDPSNPDFQLVESIPWAFGASYHIGVDTLSMTLIMLTTFLTPICILASWSIEKQVGSYMVLFLVLETLMIGVFCAQDIVLFYVFFEGGLIPMFILIGVWGGARRVYAAFKFFLYTLLGSLLMLVAIVAMISIAGTSDIQELTAYAQSTGFDPNLQIWLWLAFFASFAVKLPMWPVHHLVAGRPR